MSLSTSPRSPVWPGGLLLAASGALGLVNELLWVQALAPALGGSNAAQAAVLGTFFLGLALGGGLGAVLARGGDLYRRYAGCEVLAGGGALLPLLAAEAGWGPLALLALLPGAAGAGAAWPLLAGASGARGRALAGLYACAAGGAALGAVLAGFVLLESVGLRVGLLSSGVLSLVVAALAYWGVGTLPPNAEDPSEEVASAEVPGAKVSPYLLGGLSGGLVLALEVLGARLLAHRLPHTVYSDAVVLAVTLLALTGGALLARRALGAGARGLARLVLTAGLSVGAAPLLYGCLPPVRDVGSWGQALGRATFEAAVVLGPAALALGALFPAASALLDHGAGPDRSARLTRALGGLTALNAVLGLLGALLAGFVVAPWLGLTGGLALLGVLTLALGAWLARPRLGPLELVLLGSGLVVIPLAATRTPLRLREGEELLDLRHGAAGSLAVIADAEGERRLVANGRYTLGGSAGRTEIRRLGLLPAILRPGARDVLYVGMGTGITAGAAQAAAELDGGSVEVVELMPEAFELAPRFEPWPEGSPPRRTAGDGRRRLSAPGQKWDLVVFDLLLPWRPGAGRLYSYESFQTARQALRPGGACGVWLPVYQLSPRGLLAVAHTFAEVFPGSVVHLHDVQPERPFLLLFSLPERPLLAERARRRLAEGGLIGDDPLLRSAGASAATRLGRLEPLVQGLARRWDQPLETLHDDRPWLAFECSRARARGELTDVRRTFDLLELSLILEPPSGPAARALRAAWLPPDQAALALNGLLDELGRQRGPRRFGSGRRREPGPEPLIVRVAEGAAVRALAQGDDLAAGRLAGAIARGSQGPRRSEAEAAARERLTKAGAEDELARLLSILHPPPPRELPPLRPPLGPR